MSQEANEMCEYCDEIIIEEDSCEGSLYTGIKLCVHCLPDWQYDDKCDCDPCSQAAYDSMIDCQIDDARMGE